MMTDPTRHPRTGRIPSDRFTHHLCAIGLLCASAVPLNAQSWATTDAVQAPSLAEAVTVAGDGTAYVSGFYKDATGRNHAMIAKSVDDGLTWSTAADFPSVNDAAAPNGSAASFRAITSAEVAGDGSHVVAVGRIKRVPFGTTYTGQWLAVRSRDGGNSWQTIDEWSHPTYSLLSGETFPEGVAVDGKGSIYMAGAAHETVVTVNRNKSTSKTVNRWIVRKGLATPNGLVWSTVGDFADAAASETERLNTYPSGVACVGDDVYVVGGGGGSWIVRKSSNGGSTWQVVDNFRFSTSSTSHAFGIAADRLGNVFVVGEGRQTVTSGQGKSATTVTTQTWIVRKLPVGGTSWEPMNQYQYPASGGSAGAYAVTVAPNNDVHVTGYGSTASMPKRWITRQFAVSSGVWRTTDDFSTASGATAEGRGLAAAPSGNLFAAGVATYPPAPEFGWLVRRNGEATSEDTWASRPTQGTVTGHVYHSTVWTGTELIIWGGSGPKNTGERYNPLTNTWTPMTTVGAPAPRYYHTAVWTGNEMIVWGGYPGPSGHFNDGGRYNPATDTWTRVTTVGAPPGRRDHTAVWTGSEMLVWGGSSTNSSLGGRYNPDTDTWLPMNAAGAPSAREYHTAVWTGSEMIVWGGATLWSSSGYTYLNDGGRYQPTTDSWVATATSDAPPPRSAHSMVWTGTEVIIWGGQNGDGRRFSDGARYNPATNSWTAMSPGGSPSPRAWHAGIWTGTEMIVWAGHDGTSDLFTGGRYHPASNTWAPMTTFGAPPPSQIRSHAAAWTGTELLVWVNYSGSHLLNFTYFPE